MKPADFVEKYLSDAIVCEQTTGILSVVTLAQAALESAWGEHAPDNEFFGIKDTDGVNGNEILIETEEYSRLFTNKPSTVGLITIDKSEPVMIHGFKWFKYYGKAYFRKYDTPALAFIDHAKFFLQNERYAAALKVKDNYTLFIQAITVAGYGSGPQYAQVLIEVAKEIDALIPKNIAA